MSRSEQDGAPNVRRLTRPTRWFTPVLGSLTTMAAWFAVAHSSGAGWVQVTGALLAAVLIVGMLAPAVPAARARVTVVSSPGDAHVGRPVHLTLDADRPVRLRLRLPTGRSTPAGGWMSGHRHVEVSGTPLRRGVIEEIIVEVGSSAPFGLLWWCRDVRLTLPSPLHVAPRIVEADTVEQRRPGAEGESEIRVPSALGEPRGVRPYQPGDPRRSVHWPATAHAGALMVRESERPIDEPHVIDVILPDDTDAGDAIAEHAQANAGALIDRGEGVVLITHEPTGRVMRPLTDRTDLGRRLARAVSPGLDDERGGSEPR